MPLGVSAGLVIVLFAPLAGCTDLARMEWALRSAFDAADGQAIGVAALAGVVADAWPSLRFDAMPGVQLLELVWNVAPVWRALQELGEDAAPELPPPQPLAHSLLVWRHGLSPRWRSIEPLPARLLQAALQGARFDALCTLAEEAVGADAAALTVATALQGWLGDGLFSAWRTD